MKEEAFYRDPGSGGWPAPNLIAGLIAAPTTETLSPLERQATIVLAWLAHHSRTFAVAFLERFLAGDDEVLASKLANEAVIGARAWGTLRGLEGVTGYIYPDLTIAGSERSFELIVEVKIDAQLHWWPLPDGTRLYQPDAYIRSWAENYDPEFEATIRRVGTLTRNGPGIELAPHPFRAADVRWQDVRDVLAALLEEGRLEPEVLAVALDAAAAIDQRILLVKQPPPIDDPVMSWGYSFLTALAPAVAAQLVDGSLKKGPAVYGDYTGVLVYFETPFGAQRLWLYISPSEGKYNAPDCGSTVWIAEAPDTRWPPALQHLVQSAGTSEVKDRAGFTSYRLGLNSVDVQGVGDSDDQVAYVIKAASPLLAALRAG